MDELIEAAAEAREQLAQRDAVHIANAVGQMLGGGN